MKLYRLVCVLFAVSIPAFGEPPQGAADLLHAGLTAMGGEDKLRSLAAPHFQAVSERNALEQSERPEGPYILENHEVEEWRDLAHGSWKRTAKIHAAMQPEFVMTEVVSGGAASLTYDGHQVPASGEQLQNAEEALALSRRSLLHDAHRAHSVVCGRESGATGSLRHFDLGRNETERQRRGTGRNHL